MLTFTNYAQVETGTSEIKAMREYMLKTGFPPFNTTVMLGIIYHIKTPNIKKFTIHSHVVSTFSK